MPKTKESPVSPTKPIDELNPVDQKTPKDITTGWKKVSAYIKKNFLSIALTLALVILVIIALFVFFQNSQKQLSLETSSTRESFDRLFEQTGFNQKILSSPSPSPSPSPTPIWILPGKETYTISQSDKSGPRINKISIDPQDPTTNTKQTIIADLSHSQPIDKVELKLVSDNEEKLATMSLTSGTSKDGIWETDWETTDSILYKYVITLTASSQDQKSVIDLTIR